LLIALVTGYCHRPAESLTPSQRIGWAAQPQDRVPRAPHRPAQAHPRRPGPPHRHHRPLHRPPQITRPLDRSAVIRRSGGRRAPCSCVASPLTCAPSASARSHAPEIPPRSRETPAFSGLVR